MKLTNDIMHTILDALNNPVFLNNKNKKFSYMVFRNVRKLQSELQDYLKIRDELIMKYGTKDNDVYSIDSSDEESYKSFISELSSIAKIEIDIDLYVCDVEQDFEVPYCEDLSASQYLLIDSLLVNREKTDDNK